MAYSYQGTLSVSDDGSSGLSGELNYGVQSLSPVSTSDYNTLTNKPRINNVELVGNITTERLGIRNGEDGFSPTIEENPNNTDEIYKLDITNENGTFTTPNLKGTDGGLDPDRYYDKTQVDALIEPLNEAKHTHENKENVLDKLTTNATGDTLLFNGQEIKGSVEIDDTTTTAADKVWSAKKTNDTIDAIKVWVDSEESLAIKTALYNNNTLTFYKKPNATIDDTADFSINLPEEQFLDQTKTTFINNFVWSEELYPNSTNPNLDNEPVLVLAVKGDTDVVYSFVSMNELVKIYKASTTVSTVTLTIDDATNTISAKVNISADEDNLLKIGTDGGLYAKATVDNALSDTSENPVQNKVINVALNSKANASDLSEHTGNEDIHVTADEKARWNNKAELSDIPTSLPANGGNADTVDGLHAWTHAVLNTEGFFDRNDYFLCKDNAFSDGRYALLSGSNKEIRVHYASNADTVDGLHANEIASNPNLLINPDFKINQRGETAWSIGASNKYFVDRWYSARTNLSLSDDGLMLAWNGKDGSDGWIQEKVETKALFGKTVTVSVNANDKIYTITNTIPETVNASTAKLIEGTTMKVTLTNHGGNFFAVVLHSTSTTPSLIKWIKCELGTIATPFIPPDPATELAKCQRYYYSTYQGVPAGTPASYANELVLNATSTNRFNHTMIDFPTTMRTTPTVIFFDPDTGEEGYAHKSGTNEKVPVNIIIAGQDRVNFGSSGLTVGTDYYLHYIASAEL